MSRSITKVLKMSNNEAKLAFVDNINMGKIVVSPFRVKVSFKNTGFVPRIKRSMAFVRKLN